jgi:subtilisin family serine protease
LMPESAYLINLLSGDFQDRLLVDLQEAGCENWQTWSQFPLIAIAFLNTAQALQVESWSYVKSIDLDSALETSTVILLVPQGTTTIRSQNTQSWALDRIDQRSSAPDNEFNVIPAGQGTHVYIIDSGIRMDHEEIQHAMAPLQYHWDYNRTVNDPLYAWPDPSSNHGTHVASLVAGKDFGVAPSTTIHSIRVVDGSGVAYTNNIISGLNQALLYHQTQGGPSVVNISLNGLGRFTIFETIFQTMIAAGMIIVVSAGNQEAEAFNYWPASAGVYKTLAGVVLFNTSVKPIVVAASSHPVIIGDGFEDILATQLAWGEGGSNWGRAVDIIAPGTRVMGAGVSDNQEIVERSGTSQAAALVSGVAALYLEIDSTLTHQAMRSLLISRSTRGLVRGCSTPSPTPNRLVNAWWVPTQLSWVTNSFSIIQVENTTVVHTFEAQSLVNQDYEEITYSLSGLAALGSETLPAGLSIHLSTRRNNGGRLYEFSTVADITVTCPELIRDQTVECTLTADDGRGQAITQTIELNLRDLAKKPKWISHRNGEVLRPPSASGRTPLGYWQDDVLDPIIFQAVDPDYPDNQRLRFEWFVNDAPMQLIETNEQNSRGKYIFPGKATYRVTLRVTDADGKSQDM